MNLRLALIGLSVPLQAEDSGSAQLVAPILARQRELSRRLSDRLCAVDQRIQAFLDDYLAGVFAEDEPSPTLPRRTLVLDEPGLARDRVAAGQRRLVHLAAAVQLPAGQRRPAQPRQRPPHHRRRLPHRRGWPADPRRQDRRSQSGVRTAAHPGVRAARGRSGAAVPGRHRAPGRLLRLAAAASAGLPRGARFRQRTPDGNPLHRPRRPGRQPRLRRGHLRQRRRPVPARERRVPRPRAPGPATPAA